MLLWVLYGIVVLLDIILIGWISWINREPINKITLADIGWCVICIIVPFINLLICGLLLQYIIERIDFEDIIIWKRADSEQD